MEYPYLLAFNYFLRIISKKERGGNKMAQILPSIFGADIMHLQDDINF